MDVVAKTPVREKEKKKETCGLIKSDAAQACSEIFKH